jgi:hypothetical protein
VRRRSVIALLAALALAGCGGSDKGSESSPTTTQSTAEKQAAFANSLCGALATWKNSLNSVGTTLKGGDLTKEKLQHAATTVSDANKKLADDVDSLGAPPQGGGTQAKTALKTLSNELQTSADQIEEAAKGISNAQSALAAVSTASAALLKMSTDISATITQLQGLNVAQGWKDAFANSSSCQSLSKS